MRGFFQGACAALVAFAVAGMTGGSLRPQPENVAALDRDRHDVRPAGAEADQLDAQRRDGAPGHCRARPAGALACETRPETHICFVAPHAWPVLSRDPRIRWSAAPRCSRRCSRACSPRRLPRVDDLPRLRPAGPRAGRRRRRCTRRFALDAGLPVLRFLHPRLTSMWRALREVDADIYYHRSASMLAWRGRRVLPPPRQALDLRRRLRHGLRARRRRPDRAARATAGSTAAACARVDRIVVQNEAQRVSLPRAPTGATRVLIPSCYELPAAQRVPHAGRRDSCCGSARMQPDQAAGAAARARARLPQRRFVMIGGRG